MTSRVKITELGLTGEESFQEKRTVVLSNYLALILSGASILLFIFIRENHNVSAFLEMLVEIFIFSIPILFNYFRYINLSRLYLCWLPPVLIMWYMATGMKESEVVYVSSYDGLRFYLLAMSCIPYLLLDKSNVVLLVVGVTPGLVSLVFCDFFLDLMGVGYTQKGNVDLGYGFTSIRVLVSYVIINGSCLALNFIITKTDRVNLNLLSELEEKNRVILKQAETEVHQLNQELYRNLQELNEREFILNQSQRIAKIGSWEYRIEHAFLFWSDEMYNIFGLNKDFDLKAKNLWEIMFGDQSAILMDANVTLLRTAEPYDLILRARTPFGYTKWVRVIAFPIRSGNNAIGIRGVCHDITYFKEAEELLRTRESNYRSLFEQASDFILVIDFQGHITEANESVCSEFGYTRQELTQMKVEALIDPEQLKELPIRYAELDRGDHILSDRRMQRRDGSIVEVEANVKKVNENKILVIARDVSKLREIQMQIQLSEARFRGAFEFSAIGMAIVSLEGNWMKVNRQLCHMFGYSEAELLSSRFQDITHPEDIQKDIELFNQSITGEIITYQREKRYFHKSGVTLWANVSVSLVRNNRNEPLYFVSQIENISDKKKAEFEKERARYLLNERIKELTTLYKTSQLLHAESKSIGETLQEIVSILPYGWQYPEISAARIVLDRKEYKTPNFDSGVHKQSAEFRTSFGSYGIVEIVYLEERPIETEGPFLAEERNLINLVAEMLEVYLTRHYGEEALKKSDANLNATINNTEVLIWSVDREFRLLMFNRPFFNYIKDHYSVEIRLGAKVLERPNAAENEIQLWWEQNYSKSLAGEVITLDETRFGIDFQYSLSPIVEDDRITGVSVFADNVTERKTHDREMAEANKKIGELKLMALRSVMSPHFIFNVLNSIQFFIAKNDRLNAINYLSTFSKLIRSILTHSVDNKIKLTEEIEMLKNYIQLEMVRFENAFHFVLEIDPSIDADTIEIPSLLIQPYVENAILHGLYNKRSPGTLTIRVTEQDEILCFQIEDDGIGREAALKLRQQNFPTHKSMGIKLTEERLKLINAHHQTTLDVEDLVNDKGPCGTKVTIKISYQSI